MEPEPDTGSIYGHMCATLNERYSMSMLRLGMSSHIDV